MLQVSEHASWSGCFYLRIIQAALSAVGAPENLVEVITGFAFITYYSSTSLFSVNLMRESLSFQVCRDWRSSSFFS